MVPGFVQLGALAVAAQLAVVGGLYGYLQYRHPVEDAATRSRVVWGLGASSGLLAVGQLAALAAVGSLWVSPLLTLEQVIAVKNYSLLATLVGYVGVFVAFAVRSRA